MEPIPMPIILDPHRPRLVGDEMSAADAAAQARIVQDDLDRACEYGRHLWTQLDAVRGYLLEVVPDPTADIDVERLLTSPRGPGDDRGWHRWQTAYEAVTSVLAGPSGDSGFGRHEAAREAQNRRGLEHVGERTALQVALAEQEWVRVADQRGSGSVSGDGAPDQDAALQPAPTSPVPRSVSTNSEPGSLTNRADGRDAPGATTAPMADRRPLTEFGVAGAAVGVLAFLLGRRAGRRQLIA